MSILNQVGKRDSLSERTHLPIKCRGNKVCPYKVSIKSLFIFKLE